MYMFSAHSPSRLLGQNSGETETFGCYSYTSGNTKALRVRVGVSAYPLAEGPEGILKVFWRLNLPVLMESADCDKLMLRFLKNSKPPVELGS